MSSEFAPRKFFLREPAGRQMVVKPPASAVHAVRELAILKNVFAGMV
jgi:hypothetical protein